MSTDGQHDTPLVSAVFVLAYERAFRSDKYMGRAAHQLALDLIGQVNPDLSAKLHDFDGIIPITISDLFQSDSHHHWFRVSALDAEVAAAVQEVATQPSLNYASDGWTVERALVSHHDWCGSTTAAELLQNQWRPAKTFTLEFACPTSFKSIGLYRPLPDPYLVFKSLYERWQQLIGLRLPFEFTTTAVEAFARDFVSITAYKTHFVSLPIKKGGSIPAFRGRVTFHVEPDNSAVENRAKYDPVTHELYPLFRRYQRQFASLIHLLAHFAFYSGVGIKTAQGMGMVRLAGDGG